MNLNVYVPEGSLEEYQKAYIWENFWNLKEFGATGIDNVKGKDNGSVCIKAEGGSIVIDNAKGNVRIYTASGKLVKTVKANGETAKVDALQKGVYIVRTDTKVVKVSI